MRVKSKLYQRDNETRPQPGTEYSLRRNFVYVVIQIESGRHSLTLQAVEVVEDKTSARKT
jgi:hypothetical protein